ncbi:MAG: hypothetical protein LBI10_10590, partial [Deltaproteobacteria bacterium]|nr:hypothetical protein [Deltaproteobacteria bacterium]
MEGGIIGIDKKDLEVQEDLQKTLSEIGRAISDFIDQHGSSVNLGLFSDLIQLSIQFQSQLIAGIS